MFDNIRKGIFICMSKPFPITTMMYFYNYNNNALLQLQQRCTFAITTTVYIYNYNGVHLQLQQHITMVVFHPKDVCILQLGCFSLGGSLDIFGYDFSSVIVSVILGFVFSNIINVFSFTPFQHKCYWQE